LHKCNDIIVVSQGEIVDHGLYNDLMIRSKILRDFVHSVGTSDTEQYQRRTSDSGKYNYSEAYCFFFIFLNFEIRGICYSRRS
jgi:ABC-type methionine transport system ATPase subunit